MRAIAGECHRRQKCRHLTTVHGPAQRVSSRMPRTGHSQAARWDIQCDDCLTLFREVDDDGEVPAGSSAGARGT